MVNSRAVEVDCAECRGSGVCTSCSGAGTDPGCPCRLYAHVSVGAAKYGYFTSTIATPGRCMFCHGRGRVVRHTALVMTAAVKTT